MSFPLFQKPNSALLVPRYLILCFGKCCTNANSRKFRKTAKLAGVREDFFAASAREPRRAFIHAQAQTLDGMRTTREEQKQRRNFNLSNFVLMLIFIPEG